jgi:hypothetical protein
MSLCSRGSVIQGVRPQKESGLLLLVLVQEALDPTFGIKHLMLSGEKRMTIGTNFNLFIYFIFYYFEMKSRPICRIFIFE